MNKIEYLLACLNEECSEVQKETTKALRFGLNDKWNSNLDTAHKISMEMCDVLGVYTMLGEEGAIPLLDVDKLVKEKKERVLKWMPYAVERNALILPEPVAVKDKRIIVINGSGGVGKDTFIDCCSEFTTVRNISSVDRVKIAAKLLGWNGAKSDRDRKFLSDLKLLCMEYSDGPYNYIFECVTEFMLDTSSRLMFIHLREPEEIERVKLYFGAKTLLIINNNIPSIHTNMADGNVNNYKYDHVIDNSYGLDELKEEARIFVDII